MDSIQYLKKKLGFDRLFQKQTKSAREGLCCISITPNGFLLLSTMPANSDKKTTLGIREFTPCASADLAATLAAKVAEHGLENMDCTWILTPDKYQFLLMEELPVTAAEFQSAIRWKIKDLITFPVDDAIVDSFAVPSANVSAAKKNIIVIVSQKSYLSPLSDIIIESGLNLTTIDINELALRNIAALYEQDKNSVALIYMQDKSSKIIVAKQHMFYFSRRLDWGLNLVSNASQDQESIDRNIDKLSLEIQRSFDYYQSQWRLPAPTKIILAPEKAVPLDIASYLSQRLTASIQDLDLNHFLECKPLLDKNEQGQFLPLIGGAIQNEINAYATAD